MAGRGKAVTKLQRLILTLVLVVAVGYLAYYFYVTYLIASN